MSRQLREIAGRRAVLALRAGYERRAIADSRLWSSVPVLIAELIMDSGPFAPSYRRPVKKS